MPQTPTPQPIPAERPYLGRRHQVDGCAYCARCRAEGVDFHPSHDASTACQSGKRAHCSCDTCF